MSKREAIQFDGSKLKAIFAFVQMLLTLFGGSQQITFAGYLKWLTWAKNLGDNLKPIMAWLAEGAELFKKIFPQAPDASGLEMIDAETANLETEVLCMLKE